MRIVIQKFGGTSLRTTQERKKCAQHIINKLKSGYVPVVVVSAMGREGDPYSTDSLIKLALEENEILLPREKDLLLSCGELISAVLMSLNLRKNGYDAKTLSGFQAGIITDDEFSNSKVKAVDTQKIEDMLKEGIIPVVAGFQGISESGEITTFSRGGSDTTASVLAKAFNAEFIEIYSDVDGIHTADPKIVERAELLSQISYDEIVELAHKGTKIIHPRAVEIARDAKIPIFIKPVVSETAGTLIQSLKHERPITSIACKERIVYFRTEMKNGEESKVRAQMFAQIAASSVSTDFINILPDTAAFIVDEEKKRKVKKILNDLALNYSLRSDCVKISVVGTGMTGRPGVLSEILDTLIQAEIEVIQVTDSHTTISCLIKVKDKKKAINLLHECFFEDSSKKNKF